MPAVPSDTELTYESGDDDGAVTVSGHSDAAEAGLSVGESGVKWK